MLYGSNGKAHLLVGNRGGGDALYGEANNDILESEADRDLLYGGDDIPPPTSH